MTLALPLAEIKLSPRAELLIRWSSLSVFKKVCGFVVLQNAAARLTIGMDRPVQRTT